MANLRQLWVTLRTEDVESGGTDANIFLEFQRIGRSIMLPDQPGSDLESASSTTYIFDVNDLHTEDFVPGTVVLRNDNTERAAGWKCESVSIVGFAEDGKCYPLVMMPDVHRWLADDEPEGLTLVLHTLGPHEVGLPSASQ